MLLRSSSHSREARAGVGDARFSSAIQVCVPFDSTGIYDFTGGAFLLGTRLYSASRRPTAGYSYVSLPSLSEAEEEEEEENQKEVQ